MSPYIDSLISAGLKGVASACCIVHRNMPPSGPALQHCSTAAHLSKGRLQEGQFTPDTAVSRGIGCGVSDPAEINIIQRENI